MGKTAIVLGATGLTGGVLVQRLLADPIFDSIKLFSRRTMELQHPKIEEHLIDVLQLARYAEGFTGDVVFCCIGTTKAKTPDKDLYKKIDYGIPVTASQLAVENGINTFIVISAMGANSNSSVFYNCTKGEMEDFVLQQQIANTYILQPSLIGGKRTEKRFGESMAKFFMGLFGFAIPKKYKIITPETIAAAMHWLASNTYKEQKITSDKITVIANYES